MNRVLAHRASLDAPTSQNRPPALSFTAGSWFILATHVCLVSLAYTLALALRFDGTIPPRELLVLTATLPYLILLRVAALAGVGLHRTRWRHAGMQDLLALVKAITASTLLFGALLWARGDIPGFPRSVLVLDWLLAIMMLGGVRLAVRSFNEAQLSARSGRTRKRALVVGAGEAAVRLLHQLQHDAGSGLEVVGLIDDDPSKRKLRVHGRPVLGATRELVTLVPQHRIQLLVIAIPSATPSQMPRIVDCCQRTGVEFKIVPSLQELLDGRTQLHQIRPVEITDLLGREPVELDLERVRRLLVNRAVLITGGAGSIGSELARQIAALGPSRLILLDHAESRLYFTHLEIAGKYPEVAVTPAICDITDPRRLEQVFATARPDYVFHAAAYKHVPMMEANVVEAAKNNVLGTLHVVQCAVKCGAEGFVLISTDKAVRPSSVMGATKRIAEQITLGWPRLLGTQTDFRAVRFGNVLDSDGSVVPLFKRQLAGGGPLTVTHPEVTRYFMTIPEAVQLVLQAAVLPEAAGRIAMLEMGRPVRIVELAENLIRLSGLEPRRDVAITYTGLRPGEKLHEELMSHVETTVATDIEKIRIVQTREPDAALLEYAVDRLAAAVEEGDRDFLLCELCMLVPECVAPLSDQVLRARRISRRPHQGFRLPERPLPVQRT